MTQGPVLPDHAPCRLRAIEALEAVLANDAARTAAEMLAKGWDLSAEDRDFYKAWLLGRFADAIDLGWAWAQVDPGRPM